MHFACELKDDRQVYRNILEMMSAILPTMGFQFKMSYYPGMRALAELNSGNIDGLCAKPPSSFLAYPELIAVPTAIGYSSIYLYGKESKPELSRLKDKDKLVYVRGTQTIEEFIRKSGLNATVISASSVEQALKILIAGRADYFLEWQQPALHAINKLGITGQLESIRVGEKNPIYLAIHRRHQHLIDEIDRKLIVYVKETYGRETLIPY